MRDASSKRWYGKEAGAAWGDLNEREKLSALIGNFETHG